MFFLFSFFIIFCFSEKIPKSYQLYLETQSLLERRDSPKTLIPKLEESIELNPFNLLSWKLKGELHELEKEWDQSYKCYTNIINAFNDIGMDSSVFLNYNDDGEYVQEKNEELEQLIQEIDELDISEINLKRGLIQFQLKNFDLSSEAFSQTKKLLLIPSPSNPYYYKHHLLESDDEEHMKKASKLLHYLFMSYHLLGRSLSSLGDFSSSLREYDDALDHYESLKEESSYLYEEEMKSAMLGIRKERIKVIVDQLIENEQQKYKNVLKNDFDYFYFYSEKQSSNRRIRTDAQRMDLNILMRRAKFHFFCGMWFDSLNDLRLIQEELQKRNYKEKLFDLLFLPKNSVLEESEQRIKIFDPKSIEKMFSDDEKEEKMNDEKVNEIQKRLIKIYDRKGYFAKVDDFMGDEL